MTANRPTIALLVDYLVGTYQVSLLRAVEHACRERGVSLLTFVGRYLSSPDPAEATQARVYELVGPQNASGIILASGCISSRSGPEVLVDYCARHAPLPSCSLGVELPDTPSIVISNQRGLQAVVEHLIVRHGAKRIAYVGGPQANSEAAERYQGYLAALSAHGLTANDEFVEFTDFSVPGGADAVRRLLARGSRFDAIVAANDYMAMAAIDVLRGQGLSVPRDVMVVGFDDAPFARFTIPPLTTVRQPLGRLARAAVDSILSLIDGDSVPHRVEVDVDLVVRQSCGCGISPVKRHLSQPPSASRLDVARAFADKRKQVVDLLEAEVDVPSEAFGRWAERLVAALEADLDGKEGKFLAELESVLQDAQAQPDFVEELGKIVPVLRRWIRTCRPLPEVALEIEDTWHVAQNLIGNASTSVQGREKLELQVAVDIFRGAFERIGTTLNHGALRRAVASMLPGAHIERGFLGLFEENSPDRLLPLLTFVPNAPSQPNLEPFPAQHLVVRGFFSPQRHSHIVLPLSFEEDLFGLFVLEYTANETVYGMLRDHVSSALKGSSLHHVALAQTALRERLEREHLEQEAEIAARIQTAILPQQTDVDGLEICARMLPATEVGGDYYDVIPVDGGCWIGIGDVTGHGLMAGMVMLMIQSMVASLVRKEPAACPSDLVTVLNRAVYDNVRYRLKRDDHATLTLLRYKQTGEIVMSGLHEDVIVYRAATQGCELIQSPGFWTGALPDVMDLTSDHAFTLGEGDLLVLYSDGVTETMNDQNEQFGLVRLCNVVQTRASRPCQVDDIVESIIAAIQQWGTRQADDVTLLVARYCASKAIAGGSRATTSAPSEPTSGPARI